MSGKFESILSKLVDTEELIQIRISYVVLSISIGTTKKYLYFQNFTLKLAKVGFDHDTTKYCSQLVRPSSSKNFVCSKLTIETLEKDVKYALSCNDVVLLPLLITFSHLFFCFHC